MVNGRASLAIYIGAWIAVLTCIVGIVVLAAGEHAIPDELKFFGGAALGILGGAHIAPPVSKVVTGKLIDAQEARKHG